MEPTPPTLLRYMLMEQLKLIKKELGLERDDKEALTAKFAERIADVEMPEEARYTPLPCYSTLSC